MNDPIFNDLKLKRSKAFLIFKRVLCFVIVLSISSIGIYSRGLGKINEKVIDNSTNVSAVLKILRN
jgi:hypothetical protein